MKNFISITISFPGSLSFKRVTGNKVVIVTFFFFQLHVSALKASETSCILIGSVLHGLHQRFSKDSKNVVKQKSSIVIKNYESFSLLFLGYYVYAEASNPRQTGDRAHLVSPSLTGDFCVQFYYHMYGSSMGTLRVLRLRGSQRTIVGAFTGDRGNVWHLANIDLPAAQIQQVKFGSSLNDDKGDNCCDLIMTVIM